MWQNRRNLAGETPRGRAALVFLNASHSRDACSGKDWPRNPIPPNLFSACPKFRNSGGFWGEEDSRRRIGVGVHQNAKISFNKGKVWKRGEERGLTGKAKTVSRPFQPPPPCLFPAKMYSWWIIWLLPSFQTIAQGLRFPPSYNCIIRIFPPSPSSSSICIWKISNGCIGFILYHSKFLQMFCGLLGVYVFIILSYRFHNFQCIL